MILRKSDKTPLPKAVFFILETTLIATAYLIFMWAILGTDEVKPYLGIDMLFLLLKFALGNAVGYFFMHLDQKYGNKKALKD